MTTFDEAEESATKRFNLSQTLLVGNYDKISKQFVEYLKIVDEMKRMEDVLTTKRLTSSEHIDLMKRILELDKKKDELEAERLKIIDQ